MKRSVGDLGVQYRNGQLDLNRFGTEIGSTSEDISEEQGTEVLLSAFVVCHRRRNNLGGPFRGRPLLESARAQHRRGLDL